MTRAETIVWLLVDVLGGAVAGGLIGFGVPFGLVLLLGGGMRGDGDWNGVLAVGLGFWVCLLGLVVGGAGWPLWRRRQRKRVGRGAGAP